MVLIKVLKRKDASSVLVAILIAMIINQPLSMMTGKPATIISGLGHKQGGFMWFGYGPDGGWQSQYLFPIVWIIVQLVVLEILGWILIFLSKPFRKTAK